LPAGAPRDVEIEWVHQERILVIEKRRGKESRLHLERATRPAPSKGAVALMQTAASADLEFTEMLFRAKPSDDDDAEMVKRERKSLAEVERILDEMLESKRCPTAN
jgi:hypothetical protein